jgi:hypothetical protein
MSEFIQSNNWRRNNINYRARTIEREEANAAMGEPEF